MHNLQQIINLVNKLGRINSCIYQVWICCVDDKGITTYDFSKTELTPVDKQVVYTTKEN